MARRKPNGIFGLLVILLLGSLVIGVPLVLVMTRPEPEYLYSRSSIANNLRIIEGAKEQWALENKKDAGTLPTLADLAPFFKGGKMPPPAIRETYTINPVGTKATAKIPVPVGRFPAGSLIDIDSFK